MKLQTFDIENWREIGATLSRNRTRTFLTAFGIFWGTAMLALLLGGASGLKGLMMRNFNGVATNMGIVFPQRTTLSYRGFNKGLQWKLSAQDIEAVRRGSKAIEYSSALNYSGASVKYGTKSTGAQMQGIEPDLNHIQVPTLHAGRLINDSDQSNGRKVAVIGKNVASELFGSEDAIGKFISINNIYFMVVGVVSQTQEVNIGGRLDDSVLLPSTTMRRALNIGDDIDGFIFTALPGHSPKEIVPVLRRSVVRNHPVSPDDEAAIGFMDISDNFAMVDNLFLGLNLLALFVGIGSLLAGIIGVGNIMWIIVKERTQEIGIRRAIGAKPRDIIAQILSESMVLTAIAGIAGVCFAVIILAVTNHALMDPVRGSAHFELSFSSALGIMAVFLILGTAAGLIPSIKAMRIKPIEAINDK